MKFNFGLVALATVQLVSALPGVGNTLHKRMLASDVADIGYATLNGGTTGGSGGVTITVTTLAALKAAAASTTPTMIIISGTIVGNEVVKVAADKTIFGGSRGGSLVGIGLRVLSVNNVIIRNITISKVLADAGDAIGIQAANNVWVDHVTLSSDLDHDKDYYDGLVDITHGSQYVTVSWSILRDHWKASLVGHSDSNGVEDVNLKVTFALNYWTNLNSRLPSFRFGCGHIFNNYYESSNDGINSRDGAMLLVENNVFQDVTDPIYSTNGGTVIDNGNVFNPGSNTAPVGLFNCPTYSYTLIDASYVQAVVVAGAGAH